MSAVRPSRRDLEAVIAQLRDELLHRRREVKQLRVENEILREAAEPLIHHAPARERFAFVHARRGRFSVYRMCQVLATDSCNYHGRERQGVEVGRRRVTRLMREHGIQGVTRRRRRNLKKPDTGAAAVPDLIRRDFTAPIPGLRLTGEISCFPTGEGWLYLATVLDLCSRELIGYAIAPHMRAGLAVEAITAAHRTGLVAGNAIMHTDRGSQYHSTAHRNALQRLEIRQSTSRTGSCLDDAAAESFFATIKAEIGADSWPDRASARRDIENWITNYNHRRLHSTLNYQTPMSTRNAWQERMSMAA